MANSDREPALLLMTTKEKRAYVIDVVTHLAQFEKTPAPEAFTQEWKDVIAEGVEQMWEFLDDFIKKEGLT